MRYAKGLWALPVVGLAALAGCDDDDDLTSPAEPTSFTVTVENVSTTGVLSTDRAGGSVPLSPGVFVVFDGEDPTFEVGGTADSGTELIAEDGFPEPMAGITAQTEREILQAASNASVVGVFASPGAGTLGPDDPAIFPGESASFDFTASPGQRLQIETMFVQSNDWFYAFGGGGLDLFDGDDPISGSVAAQLVVYDAGTEEDTAPGTGPDQKPVQDPTATDVGPADDDPTIRPASQNGFSIPANSQVISVTLTPQN